VSRSRRRCPHQTTSGADHRRSQRDSAPWRRRPMPDADETALGRVQHERGSRWRAPVLKTAFPNAAVYMMDAIPTPEAARTYSRCKLHHQRRSSCLSTARLSSRSTTGVERGRRRRAMLLRHRASRSGADIPKGGRRRLDGETGDGSFLNELDSRGDSG
jgi:hypothetical protein